MPKPHLLDTRTTNFLELVGNGRVYKVPPYQRDYSWDEEQWEDLWNDLQDLRGRDERHYMGAIVVEPQSDREFVVIDGQQRIATLSIPRSSSSRGCRGSLETESSRRRTGAAGGAPAGSSERRNRPWWKAASLLNETDDAFWTTSFSFVRH
jgi:hypothetical protein